MSSFRKSPIDSIFRPLRGKGRLSSKSRKLSERLRHSAVETLEARQMLTRVTLFVDFGNARPKMTALDLFQVAIGPQLVKADPMAMPAPIAVPQPDPAQGIYDPTTVLTFEPLQGVLGDRGIDFNNDGQAGTAADATALENSVINILQRIYAPFDVNVQIAPGAASAQDVMATLGGAPAGSAYVFACGILNGMGGAGNTGRLNGTVAGDRQAVTANPNANPAYPGQVVFGDASATDEVAGGNPTSECALVYADALAEYSSDFTFGFPLDVGIANTVARESGKTFGLLTIERNQVSSSDVMAGDGDSPDAAAPPGTPDNSNLLNIGMFTRYPQAAQFTRVPGNPGAMPPVPPSVTGNATFDLQNAYDVLKANIGLNSNATAFPFSDFVTGTGAFDQLLIKASATPNKADVIVTAYTDNTFTTPITIGDPNANPAVVTYQTTVDYTNGFLVDLGRGDDRVAIDGTLGQSILVRGGQGDTEVDVIGDGTVSGQFTPGMTAQSVPGLGDTTITGEVDVFTGGGQTTINMEELTNLSTVFASNYDTFKFVSPGNGPAILQTNGSAPFGGVVDINGQINDPTTGPVDTAILQFQNVTNFFVDCTNGTSDDVLTILDGGLVADGLMNFEFDGGDGADLLSIQWDDISLPVPGGAFTYDGGNDVDTVETLADTDWTLTDADPILGTTAVLDCGGGGSVVLLNLDGEIANLSGGDSANTIDVVTWAGTGTIHGLGGDDMIIFGDDADPANVLTVTGSFDAFGDAGNDTLQTNAWSGTSLNLSGDDGNDNFQFGALSASLDNVTSRPVVIGGVGNDVMTLDDSINVNPENYDLDPTQVQVSANTPTPVPAFAGVTFDGTLETASLKGTQGKNVFYATPSFNTQLRIDGQDPVPGTLAPGGDVLVVKFPREGGQHFIPKGTRLDGSGVWTFTHGQQPIFFQHIEIQGNFVAAGADVGRGSKPLVKVYNSSTEQLMFSFYAYSQSFAGGVRVFMADVNGDSVLDVIVAPGAGKVPGLAGDQVKVYDGAQLALAGLGSPTGLVANPEPALIGNAIIPQPTSYLGGLYVAAADFDNDGKAEIITSRSKGVSQIQIFNYNSGTSTYQSFATPFAPYAKTVTTGALVAAGDVDGDGRVEIVTAPGSGNVATIREFALDATAPVNQFLLMRQFQAFETKFKSGVSLAVGDVSGDGIAEIMVGAGSGGGSRVRTFDEFGDLLSEFRAFTSGNVNAPLRLSARTPYAPESGIKTALLYVAQSNDGRSREIRLFAPLSGTLVDKILDTEPAFNGGIWMG